MNATHISTVRSPENLAELRNYVNPPIDEIRHVKRPKNNKLRFELCKLIGKIVEMIRPDINEIKTKVEQLVKHFLHTFSPKTPHL